MRSIRPQVCSETGRSVSNWNFLESEGTSEICLHFPTTAS